MHFRDDLNRQHSAQERWPNISLFIGTECTENSLKHGNQSVMRPMNRLIAKTWMLSIRDKQYSRQKTQLD